MLAMFHLQVSAKSFEEMVADLSKSDEVLCAKGQFSKFKLSIRSFNGQQCKLRLIAAIAELVCPNKNTDSYKDSNCHKNALSTLNGESPSAALIDELKKNASKYETLLCPYMASVCDAIKTAKSYIP